jgi:signal transduction histidine kinase
MEDRGQLFAAFVLETLTRQSTELGQRWAERAELGAVDAGEPDGDGDAAEPFGGGAARLVRALLAAAADGAHRYEFLIQTGAAMGVEAHRRNASLHLMLKEVDLLTALMLRAAEGVAAEYPANAVGREGLAVARRIASATSQLRLAAATGYAQAIEDELRDRYRAIRHDLRNPLGTIKSAVALLTDESVPAEMRESRRVRALVVRSTSSLDQMIGDALSDDAARLRAFETSAFDTSREAPADVPADSLPASTTTSGREQGDDLARARERPDSESGAL